MLCCLATALPATASAELQSFDFESGPALNTPVEGFGNVHFVKALGFRPYRTTVGARAHSGTTVGDLGRCLQEETEPSNCENFEANTFARLDRSATSVTVFAGVFADLPGADPEQVTLRTFRTNGTLVGLRGPVGIDDSGFNTQLTVSNPDGEITSFEVFAVRHGADGDAPAGDLGIDDVRVNFADGAKPDFGVSTTNQVIPVVEGTHVDVPVNLSRVNGSTGEVLLSVTGLPQGISGTFTPNPLLDTQTKATLRLTAAADAPDTDFVPTDATIKAEPIGGAEAGSASRSATLSVRVAANFALSVPGFPDPSKLPEGRVPIEAPDCAPVDVPLRIRRDISFNQQSITLSLREDGAVGLPPDVSAEILPSPVVAPGGGLDAERTLRIRAGSKSDLASLSRHLVLIGKTGSGAGEASHQLPLDLIHARGTATIEQSRAHTPRFGGNGTLLRITGSGFCPGSSFQVGNELAKAQPLSLGEHSAEILTPRNATSGSIVVVPPGKLPKYTSEGTLTVDSFRNTDGFQFENNAFSDLSLGEFTRAFGADDLFIKVNLCFPFGDCSVPTGVLNPLSTLDWQIIKRAYRGSRAHCFGISLAAQRLRTGKDSYGEFAASDSSRRPTQAFDLSGPAGPSADLNSYLDAMHVRQSSQEFISEYFNRPKSLEDQIKTLETEFAHQRTPIIYWSDKKRTLGGHSILAYDMTLTPERADIYVYENQTPYWAEENTAAPSHVNRLNTGVIHIDRVTKTWSTTEASNLGTIPIPAEAGGDDGSIWVVPSATIPDNPSLPSEDTTREFLEYLIFGSSSGAAVPVASLASHAEFLPVLNGADGTGGDGTFVKRASGHPLDVTVRGLKNGTYSQAYVAPGFVASVDGVATAKGLRDHVRGSGDALTFSGSRARPLAIKLAQKSVSATRSATLQTRASADGSDSAGFADNGALTYAHDGAATAIDFSLTTIRPNGGPATFASGPVRVHNGDRLSVRALDADLSRVRLTVRNGARTRTRILRNHARSSLHLKLAKPRVAGRRLSTRLRVSGGTGHAVVGTVLRLMRGDRLVAQKAVSVKTSKRARKISWRLPHAVGKGHYRLLTIARAVALAGPGSTGSASVDARRNAALNVKR